MVYHVETKLKSPSKTYQIKIEAAAKKNAQCFGAIMAATESSKFTQFGHSGERTSNKQVSTFT